MTHRVVSVGTGNTGVHALPLRGVIEHPDLDLAGHWVHSNDKAGRDAGELCGLPPTGIAATQDLDSLLDLKPDCVLYMKADPDAPTVSAPPRLSSRSAA